MGGGLGTEVMLYKHHDHERIIQLLTSSNVLLVGHTRRKHYLRLAVQREHLGRRRLVTASSLASTMLSNMFASDDKKND